MDFKAGDKVIFGRRHGEQTIGRVVRVNRRSLTVEQLEARGTLRDYPVGTKWKVSRALVRLAEEAEAAPAKAATPAPAKAAPRNVDAQRARWAEAGRKAAETRRKREEELAEVRRAAEAQGRTVEPGYPRRAVLVNILTGKRTYGPVVCDADEEAAVCEQMFEARAS